MVEVITGLYVGSDVDVPTARERGYAVCTCAKDGPNGHRELLGYTTRAAPKGKDYYFVRRGKHLALNLIDADDPAYIPDQVIKAALTFIGEQRAEGKSVLVHCNMGHSRGPSVAMMFMRSIGELPQHSFLLSAHIFRALYPKYDPEQGIRQYARSHWAALAPKE